jgi:hypothetical protein
VININRQVQDVDKPETRRSVRMKLIITNDSCFIGIQATIIALNLFTSFIKDKVLLKKPFLLFVAGRFILVNGYFPFFTSSTRHRLFESQTALATAYEIKNLR